MPSKPIKEKNGWTIRANWTDSNGKQQRKYKSGFAKAKDAKEWAIEYESQNQAAPTDSHKILTKTYLENWLEIRSASKDVEANTVRNNRNDINKLIPYIGDIPLQNLRLDQIQVALNSAKRKNNKDLSPRSKEMIRQTIRQALSYAVTAKILKNNPSIGLTTPKPDEPKYYVLEPQEALDQLKLLYEMEHECYIPFALAIFAGLRRGEALGLSWSDVDFDKREIYITSQYTIENKKPVHKKRLKTGSSRNMVPIIDSLYNILVDHKANQEESGRIEKYVCAINGKLPDLLHFNRKLTNFQKANGFRACRFHDLRHTYATLLLVADVDIVTISEMLRHKTKTLAIKTYLHPNGEMKHKAAKKFSNVFTLKEDTKKTLPRKTAD